LVSLEHIHSSGSLNNLQARPNADGTITYVVAATDPGVYNWLSTSKVHEGNILIRWQALPKPANADSAVRSVRVVKLAELASALPAGTVRVTAAQRRQQFEQRAASYAYRYTAKPAAASLASSH
jgi:hypothetical protein